MHLSEFAIFALMKFLIHLFTIYIFSLSLVPCGDGGGGIMVLADKLFGEELQIILDLDQNSDPCEDGSCSPFCICSSCYVAFEIAKEYFLPEKVFPPSPKTTPSFIIHFYTSSFVNSIWQPPKLG